MDDRGDTRLFHKVDQESASDRKSFLPIFLFQTVFELEERFQILFFRLKNDLPAEVSLLLLLAARFNSSL